MSTLRSLFDRQRDAFINNETRSLEWRLDQLDRLSRLLSENEAAFNEALALDFKTAWFERSMEFYGTLGSIEHTKTQLAGWMAPVEATISPRLKETGHKGMIYREPYGVALIIAPFNAPISLTLEPLIAALSAGNTAIVKPSETTAHMADLFEDLIGRYFDPSAVSVVRGDREIVTELLTFPFDFIFFTGSTNVGKVVMRAAAEHLTPVLLELGGQNPVIVDASANIIDAAEKIVWGTMAFAGQWCVSPGYVYVHGSVADTFAAACKAAIVKFYGANPELSADFSRIATKADVDRLAVMLEGSTVIAGGGFDRESRYFEPTIVYPADETKPIMQNEIFGPILPVLPYTDFEEVMGQIRRRPRSLAAYLFTSDEKVADSFTQSFSFGGGAINQTMIQCFMTSSMPFGGVGASGLGRYYGKYGFDSLSHAKSMIFSPSDVNIEAILPPYTAEKAQDLGRWFGA